MIWTTAARRSTRRSQAGIAARLHPAAIPANIYLSDDNDWESYATPARDARLRAAFVQFHRDLADMIQMWVNRDPRIVYDGQFLKNDLLNAYDQESRRCTTTYLSTDKHPVSLTSTMFRTGSSPCRSIPTIAWNCAGARRWKWGPGCPDQEGKRRWYALEQPARNEIGRDEQGAATMIAGPADVDIRGLIASMPDRVPFVQHYPAD